MSENGTRLPAEAFHLSEFIRDEMVARKWTRAQVAMRMGGFAIDLLTLEMIMYVHDKDLLLGKETADALGRAFNISPEYFINLDDAWRKHADEPATDAAAEKEMVE
jgi:plasmid maintenance system antidote protein VapI